MMSTHFDQLDDSKSASHSQKSLNDEDYEYNDKEESLNRTPSSVTSSGSYRLIQRSFSEKDRMRRKVWWSPKRNQVEIRHESVKYRNVQARIGSFANIEYQPGGGQKKIRDEPVQWQVSPRIDSLSNASWSPAVPSVSVRREKLNWNAQSKVNSLDNITYKPGGGSVEIHNEKLDFKHVTPRIDCGFLD